MPRVGVRDVGRKGLNGEERGGGGYPRQVSAKLSLDRQGGFSLW